MKPQDKPEFLRVLNGLAAIWRAELTPEALSIWWGAMAKWSIEDFRNAAQLLVTRSEFMPRPFDFEQLIRASETTAPEAWAQVLRHVRTSRYRTQSLADPIAERAAAAIGGFQNIGMCDEDKVHFLERRFCEAYESMQDSNRVCRALPNLNGHRLEFHEDDE